MQRSKHCVLLAVCGTSPAVITETVQAIYERFPEYVIDEVVVLTTTTGKARLVNLFFENHGWDALRKELKAAPDTLRFGNCEDSIRLIPSLDRTRNLADISTPDDHLSMANQLCLILRAHADNPSVTILASLAGGRKTMSTMMGLCFSLFARDCDRLFHVLVNDPFDLPLEPLFLFKPTTPVICRLPNGETVSTEKARIDLIDIPCVKLRKLFPEYLSTAPGSYSDLVMQANDTVEQQYNAPLSFDFAEAECTIGDTRIINGRKAPLQFIIYFCIALATVNGIQFKTSRELSDFIESFAQSLQTEPHVDRKLKQDFQITPDTVCKCMTVIRRHLAHQYQFYSICKTPQSAYILSIPPSLIVLDSHHTLQKPLNAEDTQQ